MQHRFWISAWLAVATASFCRTAAAQQKEYVSDGQKFIVETLTKRSDVVWGFDFLPDGRIVFTERAGAMGFFEPKSRKVTLIKGLPKVKAEGQGGLLDVKVHPDYAKTGWIYFTYSEPSGSGATTALARGKLQGRDTLKVEKILSAQAHSDKQIHYGSRVVFDGKGYLFFSVGERGERDQVQNLAYHSGKVLRLTEDGKVPGDNPFVKTKGALPEIWSYGHRNPQGMDRNPSTAEVWEAEMGPRGGDEVNVVRAGMNYGWPVITFGREYHGPKIGAGTEKPGVAPPVAHWEPSISPSGMAFYTGAAFPKWKGDVFLATLSGQHLRRLELQGEKVVRQEALLADLKQRFRQVRGGPDGALYFSTDDGTIARLVAKK